MRNKRTNTQCTTRARSSASALVLALGMFGGLLASTAGCTGEKPSRELCDQFVEKFGELLKNNDDPEGRNVKKLALKQRERILELCTGKGTKAEVECAMKYDTFEAIAENCK